MLITSPAAVKKAFERVDRSRSGSLNPSGVAEFLRELFKDLRPRDVHYLLQVRGGYGGGCSHSYAGEGGVWGRMFTILCR